MVEQEGMENSDGASILERAYKHAQLLIQLRRTKEKLKAIEFTPNIRWVVYDVINSVCEILDAPTFTDEQKMIITQGLIDSYKRYIKMYEPDNEEQLTFKFE